MDSTPTHSNNCSYPSLDTTTNSNIPYFSLFLYDVMMCCILRKEEEGSPQKTNNVLPLFSRLPAIGYTVANLMDEEVSRVQHSVHIL